MYVSNFYLFVYSSIHSYKQTNIYHRLTICPALGLQQLPGRQSVGSPWKSSVKEGNTGLSPSVESVVPGLHLGDSNCYNLLELFILYVLYPHSTSPLVCEFLEIKTVTYQLIRFGLYLYWGFSKSWWIVQIRDWNTVEKIRMSITWGHFCSLLYIPRVCCVAWNIIGTQPTSGLMNLKTLRFRFRLRLPKDNSWRPLLT